MSTIRNELSVRSYKPVEGSRSRGARDIAIYLLGSTSSSGPSSWLGRPRVNLLLPSSYFISGPTFNDGLVGFKRITFFGGGKYGMS